MFKTVLRNYILKWTNLFSIVLHKFHNKNLKLILKEMLTTFLPLASELVIILCSVDFSDPFQVNIGHLYQILLIHFQYNKFLKLQVQQNFDTKLVAYGMRKDVVIFFLNIIKWSLLLNSYIPTHFLEVHIIYIRFLRITKTLVCVKKVKILYVRKEAFMNRMQWKFH